MMDREISLNRRDILVIGGLLSLSGCQSIFGGDGATAPDSKAPRTTEPSTPTENGPPTNDESPTAEDPGSPSWTVDYREWVPDPAPQGDLDGHGFFMTAWPSILPGPRTGLLGSDAGIVPDALVMVPSGDAGVTVAPGTVDLETARETIKAGDTRDLNSYSGYEVYLRSAGQEFEAVAIETSGALLSTASNAKAAVEAIRTLVDAAHGEASLYYETNEDFATLSDRLGTGTRVAGRTVGEQTRVPQRLKGLSAAGDKYEITGETTELVTVAVFESSNAPGLATIETELSATLGSAPFVEQYSTEIAGRTTVSRTTVATEAIQSFLNRVRQ